MNHTLTITARDPIARARETLALARMLCLEVAKTQGDYPLVAAALEGAASAVGNRLFVLDAALDDAWLQRFHEHDAQHVLPLAEAA